MASMTVGPVPALVDVPTGVFLSIINNSAPGQRIYWATSEDECNPDDGMPLDAGEEVSTHIHSGNAYDFPRVINRVWVMSEDSDGDLRYTIA